LIVRSVVRSFVRSIEKKIGETKSIGTKRPPPLSFKLESVLLSFSFKDCFIFVKFHFFCFCLQICS
jgi:hypothetical protein